MPIPIEPPRNIRIKMPDLRFDQMNRIVITCDPHPGRLYSIIYRRFRDGMKVTETRKMEAGPEDERLGVVIVIPADGVYTSIKIAEQVGQAFSEEVPVWDGSFGFHLGDPDAAILPNSPIQDLTKSRELVKSINDSAKALSLLL